MAGDLRRLQSRPESALQAEGLRARLAGALSSLPLLLRRAGACPRPSAGDCAGIPALRAALARGDLSVLARDLEALRRKHLFEAGQILAGAATPERLRLGAVLHRQVCAGCHDAPAADTALPARDLFEEARRLPREEFAARLLLGVRGDRGTSWRNPFSDLELGALLAYYENGGPAAETRK